MGCFDSIWFSCPSCNRKLEFQSKAGSCSLNHYTVADAPIEVMADAIGYKEKCRCGNTVYIGGSVTLDPPIILPNDIPEC